MTAFMRPCGHFVKALQKWIPHTFLQPLNHTKLWGSSRSQTSGPERTQHTLPAEPNNGTSRNIRTQQWYHGPPGDRHPPTCTSDGPLYCTEPAPCRSCGGLCSSPPPGRLPTPSASWCPGRRCRRPAAGSPCPHGPPSMWLSSGGMGGEAPCAL